MALHKILVDDFYDDDYSLFAIHCTIEDYRLAYLLNQFLGIQLKRNPQDLDYEYISASYSLFDWQDERQLTNWHLVSNVCKKEEDSVISSGSLFNSPNKIIVKHNLIPEYKNVNYFLKIDNGGNYINEKPILTKLQEIPQIATAYSVDVMTLKSKEHLIFD
ncbi:IPExxxVDY family protein [Pontimicrobium sp. IMCC45349]|jgi:hypothetical protein|uniref:IPExxxVDY family protein n=1 Tax=Pontimicrobium sp. IMCC45349 TaxID=3391574 RepID=UPI0039A1C3C1